MVISRGEPGDVGELDVVDCVAAEAAPLVVFLGALVGPPRALVVALLAHVPDFAGELLLLASNTGVSLSILEADLRKSVDMALLRLVVEPRVDLRERVPDGCACCSCWSDARGVVGSLGECDRGCGSGSKKLVLVVVWVRVREESSEVGVVVVDEGKKGVLLGVGVGWSAINDAGS